MRKASYFAKVLWLPSRQAWQVRLNKGGGKLYRREFQEQEKAQEHANKLNANIPLEGSAGVVFDAVARADYAAAKQELPPGVSLLEAARFYTASQKPKIAGCTWDDGVFKLLESLERANRAEATIATTKDRLAAAKAFLRPETLSDVTTADVEAFLAQEHLKPWSRAGYRGALNSLYRFAVAKGLAVENPVNSIAAVSVDAMKVDILTADEAAALMAACVHVAGGRLVRAVALRLLAGLRPEEVTRLDEKHILPDGIRVAVGKIRGRRAVRIAPLSPALKGWLELYPDAPLDPPNFRKLIHQARDLAGIDHWQKDILRHTWISHRLAEVENENQVAREAGNSPSMIYNHYFQIVTKSEAEKFGGYSPWTETEKPAG